MILLDMDGPLVNFTDAYLELVNSKLKFDDITEWDIWKLTGQTEEQFHIILSNAGENYWSNMKPDKDGIELYKALKAKDDITILTAVFNSDAAIGKIKWIDKWLPREPITPICFDTEKWKYVSPDSILIDDKADNVRSFIKAGGQGFLYPRPWNFNDRDLPVFDIDAIPNKK